MSCVSVPGWEAEGAAWLELGGAGVGIIAGGTMAGVGCGGTLVGGGALVGGGKLFPQW